jgi:hypothetical protein
VPDGGGQRPVTFECDNVSEYQQAMAMMQAFKLFQERNADYQDAWQPGGLRANLVKLRLKLERTWRMFWVADKDPTAELLDVINYAVFCVRCADNDDWDGGWKWRGNPASLTECTCKPGGPDDIRHEEGCPCRR